MRGQWSPAVAIGLLLFAAVVHASLGDRLPDFKDCVVTCLDSSCKKNDRTSIPIHRRLLLWTCPAECDYTCQHIVTDTRLARPHPYLNPVYQFHGKWPFHRFLGIQEPFSVLFSLFNYLAHVWGMSLLRERIPVSYGLRKFYLAFGYVGLVSWGASMIFHTRDFVVTERADYFGAGANVLYGLYYAPVRICRLDNPTGNKPHKQSLLRVWSVVCGSLYLAHIAYLTIWSWDYTYNMAANIAVGILQNLMWVGFSYYRYQKSGKMWQAWPAMIVLWIVLAMSLEILDFVPWRLMIDAHSLWHLGTVGPTIWWYWFLVKDAEHDIHGIRLKA